MLHFLRDRLCCSYTSLRFLGEGVKSSIQFNCVPTKCILVSFFFSGQPDVLDVLRHDRRLSLHPDPAGPHHRLRSQLGRKLGTCWKPNHAVFIRPSLPLCTDDTHFSRQVILMILCAFTSFFCIHTIIYTYPLLPPGIPLRGDRIKRLVLRSSILHLPRVCSGHHGCRSVFRLLHPAGRLRHPQVLHQHQPDPVRDRLGALGDA